MNRNSPKYCLAEGCRYPEHHLTGYHRCGCCAGFGHGRYECPERHGHGSEVVSYDRINDLSSKYYTSSVRQLPVENWCKVFGCLARKYHATGSHQRLFVEDEFCDWTGPDRYGIKRMFAEADKGKDRVVHTPGYYVSYYLGYGYTKIWKNDNGKILLLDTDDWDAIKQFTDGFKDLDDKTNNNWKH